MPASTVPQTAKGSALRSTQVFVERQFDANVQARVLARLPEVYAQQVASAGATDEVPYHLLVALWRATDGELAQSNPAWAEQSGAFAIESIGVQLYGGILRKASPTEFLTQRVSLFRLYYHPGNMEVVEEEPGRAVLRLVGFDPVDPLFCRRQTGGLLRSVQIAGGQDATAVHCRCCLEGDAFCEWDLAWR